MAAQRISSALESQGRRMKDMNKKKYILACMWDRQEFKPDTLQSQLQGAILQAKHTRKNEHKHHI